MRTAPAALLGLFLVLLPCALRGQQPGTTAPWPEAQRELLIELFCNFMLQLR